MKYLNKKVWIDKDGYPCIWLNEKKRKRKLLHILEWEKYNGLKPTKWLIHHIDQNKENWNINNLQLVTRSEHVRIHNGWLKENGEWTKKYCSSCNQLLMLNNFYHYKKAIHNVCNKCKKKMAESKRRKNGIKPRHWIVPNEKGEYQCRVCDEWKELCLIGKRKNKPRRICKACLNSIAKEKRRKKKELKNQNGDIVDE